MKRILTLVLTLAALLTFAAQPASATDELKVHGIFRNNMVIQRDKPIVIWGWAPEGARVQVRFGEQVEMAPVNADDGRWEATFPAQEANATPQQIQVTTGDQTVTLENILIGDVWVMNGQSNMAFALRAVYEADMESAMAHLPLLRTFHINAGAESEHEEIDINDQFVNGGNEDKDWLVCTPEVANQMGAIGYVFGSRLQRVLQIPIGIIDNSRGGAAIESLVPRHMFARDPQAAEYLAWVDQRNAEFSEEAFLAAEMERYVAAEARYQQQIAQDQAAGVDRNRRRPSRPDGSIRTWSVPGRSPSDAASCYNGMFGVFKGYNIRGVAFHQGYNNSMMNTSCKPQFYRLLMRLMVQGWREDFNDPNLPVAVIGLCAGGDVQTRLNFEQLGFDTGAYTREAQRLGLADVGDPEFTEFIPAYDLRIPQLHTKKKVELGERAARWALQTVYGMEDIIWDTAELLSAEPHEGGMLLTFDSVVRVDDFGSEIEGFSIAGADGIFYMATAIPQPTDDREMQNRQIFVTSPMVSEPANVRYAWGRAPMGNLRVDGLPWQPLHSFRTDTDPFPGEVSHMDPEGGATNGAIIREMKAQAEAALQARLEAQNPAPVAE